MSSSAIDDSPHGSVPIKRLRVKISPYSYLVQDSFVFCSFSFNFLLNILVHYLRLVKKMACMFECQIENIWLLYRFLACLPQFFYCCSPYWWGNKEEKKCICDRVPSRVPFLVPVYDWIIFVVILPFWISFFLFHQSSPVPWQCFAAVPYRGCFGTITVVTIIFLFETENFLMGFALCSMVLENCTLCSIINCMSVLKNCNLLYYIYLF